ncbi:MAG TPA: hypothetical protein VGI60_14715 [Chthoniobacterales bacterium]|jgi:hypothetical protein
MKIATVLGLMALFCIPVYAAPPVKLSDVELRAKISGVWFGEVILPQMRHIGQRSQYYPDGSFACDCRLTTPGSEHCTRNVGTWKVSGGIFFETTTHCSDSQDIPTLVRHVIAMNHDHMVLETENGTRFEMWRGPFELDTRKLSVSSIDQKKLLAQMRTMHVSGFQVVPAGKGYSSIRLDTHAIAEFASKKH